MQNNNEIFTFLDKMCDILIALNDKTCPFYPKSTSWGHIDGHTYLYIHTCLRHVRTDIKEAKKLDRMTSAKNHEIETGRTENGGHVGLLA